MSNANQRKMDPQQIELIKQAAAAAKDEVLSESVLGSLLKARPEDLIGADPDGEVIKGKALPSGAWVHGPALVELFAAADKRLTRVAGWSGMNVNQVTKVRAQLLKGTKLLIIKPAPGEDLTATPVQRHSNSRAAMFNLISLLGEHGLTVESGYRERFDVAYVPKESPLWPALVIDLGQVKERRQESSSKKGGSSRQGPDPN